ncbi:uncharacterized protein LOC112561770 isoform X4 [Pomacea canaliculata]|uniref:uncharacterized protein LOC112561770 isoform X4 n=1 Tax=Pomacea canaliculata TaxID=400727 RepID=UPI000D73F4AD|nr:uncharacterized protein LOC112561770 isoform X4 [Pomacea canaliculata]
MPTFVTTVTLSSPVGVVSVDNKCTTRCRGVYNLRTKKSSPMTEYHGMNERELRALLEDCSILQERRKIRAAIKEVHGLVTESSSPLSHVALSGKVTGDHVASCSLSQVVYTPVFPSSPRPSYGISLHATSSLQVPPVTSGVMALSSNPVSLTMTASPLFTAGGALAYERRNSMATLSSAADDRLKRQRLKENIDSLSESLAQWKMKRFLSASVSVKPPASVSDKTPASVTDKTPASASARLFSVSDQPPDSPHITELLRFSRLGSKRLSVDSVDSDNTQHAPTLGTALSCEQLSAHRKSDRNVTARGDHTSSDVPPRLTVRRGSHVFLSDGDITFPVVPSHDNDDDSAFTSTATSRSSNDQTRHDGVVIQQTRRTSGGETNGGDQRVGRALYRGKWRDEDELLDLLCQSDDFRERLLIRSRLKEIKENIPGPQPGERGVHPVHDTTATPDLEAPPSSRVQQLVTSRGAPTLPSSPASSQMTDRWLGDSGALGQHHESVSLADCQSDLGGEAGLHPNYAPAPAAVRVDEDAAGDDAADVEDYDNIRDIEQLRKLLNSTCDREVKRKIRSAMRTQRRKQEMEKVRADLPPLVAPVDSSDRSSLCPAASDATASSGETTSRGRLSPFPGEGSSGSRKADVTKSSSFRESVLPRQHLQAVSDRSVTRTSSVRLSPTPRVTDSLGDRSAEVSKSVKVKDHKSPVGLLTVKQEERVHAGHPVSAPESKVVTSLVEDNERPGGTSSPQGGATGKRVPAGGDAATGSKSWEHSLRGPNVSRKPRVDSVPASTRLTRARVTRESWESVDAAAAAPPLKTEGSGSSTAGHWKSRAQESVWRLLGDELHSTSLSNESVEESSKAGHEEASTSLVSLRLAGQTVDEQSGRSTPATRHGITPTSIFSSLDKRQVSRSLHSIVSDDSSSSTSLPNGPSSAIAQLLNSQRRQSQPVTDSHTSTTPLPGPTLSNQEDENRKIVSFGDTALSGGETSAGTSGERRASSLQDLLKVEVGVGAGSHHPQRPLDEVIDSSWDSKRLSSAGSRKDDLDWDLVNQVKARLKSRSESLSSEEKFLGAVRVGQPSSQTSSKPLTSDGRSRSWRDVRRSEETSERQRRQVLHKAGDTTGADPGTDCLVVNDGEHTAAPPGVDKQLSDFQKLDKGLRPSPSKRLVSSLVGKFAATESGDRQSEDRPGQVSAEADVTVQVSELISDPEPPGKRSQRAASFRVDPTRDSEIVRSSQPRRAESFNVLDRPPRLSADRKAAPDVSAISDSLPPPPETTTGEPLTRTTRDQRSMPSTAVALSLASQPAILQTGSGDTHKSVARVKTEVKAVKAPSDPCLTSTEKPAAEIEKAFSALLDDIDMLSTSEGTASDVSDGDEYSADTTTTMNPPAAHCVRDQQAGDTRDRGSPALARGKVSAPLATLTEEVTNVDTAGDELSPTEGAAQMGVTTEDSDNDLEYIDADDMDSCTPTNTARHVPGPPEDDDLSGGNVTVIDGHTTTSAPSLPQSLPPASADDMTSSAYLVLKAQPSGEKRRTGSSNNSSNATVEQDSDGTVTYRKVSQDECHNRIVTIKSKVRRTPSNASEETRDTVVETSYQAPGGALVTERDVIQSRKKLTHRGSNYYQRTAQYMRRVRDRGGSEFVEHDVHVQADNTSVSRGQSWTSNVAARVEVDQPSGPLPANLHPLPAMLEELATLHPVEPRVAADAKVEEEEEEEEKEEEQQQQVDSDAVGGLADKQVQEPHALGDQQSLGSNTDVTAMAPMLVTPLVSQSLLTAGESLLLQCDVSGVPEPEVTWSRDGQCLPDTLSYSQSYDGARASLHVQQVEAQDGGVYECVAHNVAGRVTSRSRVTVKARSVTPRFTSQLQDVTTDAGKNVTLQCQVTGSPEPSVMWRRSGLMVQDVPDFVQTFAGGVARLQILAARDKHGGRYECMAQNEAGHASTSCHVTVTASTDPDKEGVLPRVSVRRSFKKLSEPHPADIITAALRLAEHKPLVTSRSASLQETSDLAGQLPVNAESRARSVVHIHLDGERPLSARAANGSAHGRDAAHARDWEAGSRYRVQWTDADGSVTLQPDVTITEVDEVKDRGLVPGVEDVAQSPLKKLSLQETSYSRKTAEPTPRDQLSGGRSQRSLVSQLRAQFLKEDNSGDKAGGIRRWHSMPLKQERPEVVKRGRPSLLTGEQTQGGQEAIGDTMPSYDQIEDEEELHKLMNATDSFDERKKIRARLREIRDKQRADMEARRVQRDKETEDLVRKKFEKAEEEKKRKMEAFQSQKPTCERDSQYHASADKAVLDKKKQADEEKAKKLQAYSQISEHKTPEGATVRTATTTTTMKSEDGSTTVTKKTETTVRQTSGFGGVQYGRPGATPAKPQGPRGAMAAFKQMDANSPARPNAGGGGSGGKVMTRSPSAIKQMLLDWCKAMTREYENVEVTNFSTCWNDGMAFCALIHHFFPDAFDFSQLDPKNRRYNFELAFNTAEKLADISPLLDVEDMVKMKNPDWKCVFTYVQSIYRHLRDHENNKARIEA